MPQERLVFMRKASGLVRELSMTDVIIWSIASPTAMNSISTKLI